MYRYAVAVVFNCTKRPPVRTYPDHLPFGPQLQIYIIQADTEDEARCRGVEHADEFCAKLGCINGANVIDVKAVQIPA